jgi:hypothetical protein
MRCIGEYADKGLIARPTTGFVTDAEYNHCHWLQLLELEKHYERAEIVANVSQDGSIQISALKNITRFAIHPPMLQTPMAKLRVGVQEIVLPNRKQDDPSRAHVFAQRGGNWKFVGSRAEVALNGKHPGVQGPIDDAFTGPFLCVRGTGQPWNPAVGVWADASLRRFAYDGRVHAW